MDEMPTPEIILRDLSSGVFLMAHGAHWMLSQLGESQEQALERVVTILQTVTNQLKIMMPGAGYS